MPASQIGLGLMSQLCLNALNANTPSYSEINYLPDYNHEKAWFIPNPTWTEPTWVKLNQLSNALQADSSTSP